MSIMALVRPYPARAEGVKFARARAEDTIAPTMWCSSHSLAALLAAASALAGCSREPLHGTEPTPPPSLAPEAAASAPAPIAPASAASAAPPGASSADAPSRDEVASIPEGACVRKPPAPGPPRVRAPRDDGSPLPLIKDMLAKQARAAVDACLAEARARTPGLQGRLVMTVALPPEGGVSKAVIDAGAGDGALHRCVTEALRRTAMPSFSNGGTLNLSRYVIALCPDGTAAWPTSQGWR